MKTGNQQIIQQLEDLVEELKFRNQSLTNQVEALETKGIWDEVKNRENIKFISEEVILFIDKAFRRNDEVKITE